MTFFGKLGMGALLLLTVACNPIEPMQSVENAPVQQKYSDDQVGKIIAAAALNKGWTVDDQQPGMVHVLLRWNNYSAKAGLNTAVSCVQEGCKTEGHDGAATITYTAQSYSITPDPVANSTLPNGLTYHQFNGYIDKLRHEIDRSLAEGKAS